MAKSKPVHYHMDHLDVAVPGEDCEDCRPACQHEGGAKCAACDPVLAELESLLDEQIVAARTPGSPTYDPVFDAWARKIDAWAAGNNAAKKGATR